MLELGKNKQKVIFKGLSQHIQREIPEKYWYY